MSLIVSMINNKGGVGKSTCSINLAHALALRGLKVLVVDADSQANTSSIFCPVKEATLFEVFSGGPVERSVYATSYENLSCLPNHPKTATLELELYSKVPDSYFLLRKALRSGFSENYDICIIDCPPNLGIWVIQALICCDCVVVPVTCGSRFSIEGLDAALGHIESLQKKLNKDLFFLRLLVNQVDMRSKDQKAAVAALRNQFGEEMVFETVIPRNPAFMEAETNFKTVIREAPNSTGAKSFRVLAEEFVKLLKIESEEVQLSLMES
ncbi:ParA family protein [Geoalkalibacter halelectricus]|uniref:ParA family protein n=1 Tax=Geoalkalibacter halelectricus TaxID=2847045 RepID=UPI003D22F261